MKKSLFEIKNLNCSYGPEKPVVLEIDDLSLPSGKVVFIIGESGAGKSTFLETLGMMNNTINNSFNNQFEFTFNDPYSGTATSLSSLWQKHDRDISAFRQKHYSFIFQQTNLMNNLTAFENVMITQLIQNKSKSEAYKRTREILDETGLAEIAPGTLVTELSGGQRQRLAFARAIASDFTVLFADEPTGNLDFYNAVNLMNFLIDELKKKSGSAIIVSHDFSLALKYADVIISIGRNTETDNNNHKVSKGFISADSVYSRILKTDSWFSNSGQNFDESSMIKKFRNSDISTDRYVKKSEGRRAGIL